MNIFEGSYPQGGLPQGSCAHVALHTPINGYIQGDLRIRGPTYPGMACIEQKLSVIDNIP